MHLTIRKLGVLSLGKISGVIYALFGLIFGAIFSFISVIGGFGMMFDQEMGGGAALPFFLGAGAIVLLPLFYGAMGFLSGLLTALIYNFATGMIGGLEMEVEGLAPGGYAGGEGAQPASSPAGRV